MPSRYIVNFFYFSLFIGSEPVSYTHLYVGGHISLRALRPFPKDLLKKLLGIGLPSAGENFAYSLSQITILSFINLFGTAVITTKVYASMLAMVSYI